VQELLKGSGSWKIFFLSNSQAVHPMSKRVPLRLASGEDSLRISESLLHPDLVLNSPTQPSWSPVQHSMRYGTSPRPPAASPSQRVFWGGQDMVRYACSASGMTRALAMKPPEQGQMSCRGPRPGKGCRQGDVGWQGASHSRSTTARHSAKGMLVEYCRLRESLPAS